MKSLIKNFLAYGWLSVLIAASTSTFVSRAGAADYSGNSVVVVYNSRMPGSERVARHYAAARQVPPDRLIGLELPEGETITRTEYATLIERPLLRELIRRKLWTFSGDISPVLEGRRLKKEAALGESYIRFAALCHGVPVRISPDETLREKGREKAPPQFQRNEASVDSELAMLPLIGQNPPRFGAFNNPAYGTTNSVALHPLKGVLPVSRLDGPTPELAMGLVDKAMNAETNGLWGRAYIDLRGINDPSSSYKAGDDRLLNAAQIINRHGFETTIDKKSTSFTSGFPLSHIAFYAGWYENHVAGPFARPQVEFMPGAIAYHLHSFNAAIIRSENQRWVGPLIARGVTATMGSVYEPYLELTPDLPVFFSCLIYNGLSFAEAGYASLKGMSWQTILMGDPLYRPFGTPPAMRHEQLEKQGSPLYAWSHLRWVNKGLALGAPPTEAAQYLREQPITSKSSVMLERLASIDYSQGKLKSALANYAAALALPTSPLQRQRIMLNHASLLGIFDRKEEAYAAYQNFVKEYPEFPDQSQVHRRLMELARALGKTDDETKWKQLLNGGQK